MPFDTVTLELALFLCLMRILASHPTDPYFYPWQGEPSSYRIPDYAQVRRSGAPMEGPWFPSWGQRNVTQESELPFFQYQFGYQDQRGQNSQYRRRELPVYRQVEFSNGGGQFFQPRSLKKVANEEFLNGGGGGGGGGGGYVNDYLGSQNLGNLYSSHVKCGGETGGNKEGVGNAQKNIRTHYDPIFGSESARKIDERISYEETTRSMRSGSSSKEVNVPNPRIVTPKGGRRPPLGSSSKMDNKPLNAISTTEKILRTQTPKSSKRPRPSPTKAPGGDIVFPDVYQKKFVPRVSKCAKTSTFCEHLGEEYPGDYISQVLKKEGAMFREFFGQDVISDPNITERINAPEENSLCPYRQEVVFPRAAQNKEDKWLFIVNQDQYVQGVTVEVCLNPESRCILTEGFPLGYTPYCKQKYIERRLVAIGEDGKPHSDSFRLPSCCSCVVKHEASARIAPLRVSRAPAPPSHDP